MYGSHINTVFTFLNLKCVQYTSVDFIHYSHTEPIQKVEKMFKYLQISPQPAENMTKRKKKRSTEV